MFKLNKTKLLNTINEKWLTKQCPMCGENNWTIDEDIVTAIRVDENRDIQLGGKFSPLVAVTCLNCGHVVFVNPLVIGSVEDTEKEG